MQGQPVRNELRLRIVQLHAVRTAESLLDPLPERQVYGCPVLVEILASPGRRGLSRFRFNRGAESSLRIGAKTSLNRTHGVNLQVDRVSSSLLTVSNSWN